jgi:C-terminal processing protease CtpA/Prc
MLRSGHWLAFLPMALVATPAAAQRDSIVVRKVSTWQKDVDRLREELQSQRKLEFEFMKTISTLRSRLESVAADSERVNLRAQYSLMSGKLREASFEQARIRRELETLCATVQKQEGWLGVATTGMSAIDRHDDGPQVVRFFEQPVIESVDPGSPADRVGLKAGDVLLEIGGKRLLHNNVVFAELLRPGERILVKFQRGRETMTLMPVVEPVPEVLTVSPCSLVDVRTAYVMAPVPATQAYQFEVQSTTDSPRPRVVAASPRIRRDTAGSVSGFTVAPPAASGVFAGPMVYSFGAVGNVLAGLQLVPLNAESARPLGATHGLFVNQALPGPGREAGLQGGDVLVAADSVELRSLRSLQLVMSRSRDRAVTIVLLRDRKQETVTLKW